MRVPFFIAKRIYFGDNEDKKVSQPIIRLAKISIAIAVAVNIITVAVVIGFQNEVKDKVVGFGAHATIFRMGEESAFDAKAMLDDDALRTTVLQTPGVKHIQPYAYIPAMLQSYPDTVFFQTNDIDTFQLKQEVQGVIIKGVDASFDWNFLSSNLIKGRLPNLEGLDALNEIIVSEKVANALNLDTGKIVRGFFMRQQPLVKPLQVVGIFNTGFDILDKQLLVGDLKLVQELNNWGIKAAIRIADTINNDDQLIIYADVTGGNGNYRYDWGEGFSNDKGFTFCGGKDTTIRLIASDYWSYLRGEDDHTLPDTAYLSIKVLGEKNLPCAPIHGSQLLEREFLDEEGFHFKLHFDGGKSYEIQINDGKGSHRNYIGGLELMLDDLQDLDDVAYVLKRKVVFSEDWEDYRLKLITDEFQEVFLWLDFLDLNVIIILTLMILVSSINMGSGLLVLILTKTSMIGLFKAMGASHRFIRHIFLSQVAFIVVGAMFWGNVIGLSFCFLQSYFQFIPLNPDVYYLSAVPIELKWWHWVILNLGTFTLCLFLLIVPSMAVARISPIKAIKFN